MQNEIFMGTNKLFFLFLLLYIVEKGPKSTGKRTYIEVIWNFMKHSNLLLH
jgi:hypothetical protein